jgi:DNA replication protein DnaC
MPIQTTLDRLDAMRLGGLREAVEEQLANPQYAELAFEDRLALLVDREWARREDVRLQGRLKAAHFKQRATITDLDLKPTRGLERAAVLSLAQCDWVRRGLNLVVVGPTGAGKSYLACALGNAACRDGFGVRFERMPHLLHRLALSHADGSWDRLLRQLARVPLLIIDDWLRDPLAPREARDLVDILDDRYPERSTLVASQLPVAEWHAQLPDPTLAEAVLDRLIHNAHRLELKGDSQRKVRSPLTNPDS